MTNLIKKAAVEVVAFLILVSIVTCAAGFFMAVTGAHTEMHLFQFIGTVMLGVFPIHALLYIDEHSKRKKRNI